MLTATGVIVHSLTTGKEMLARFVVDLTPQEMLHRVVPQANCAAWIVGHLTLADRSTLAGRLGVTDLPPLPEGYERRFAREEGAPQATEFGDVSLLLPLFLQHRDRLIGAVRGLDPERLGQPLPKPHPRFRTMGEALNFLGLAHVAMHAGQITIIRRSLGRPPLI